MAYSASERLQTTTSGVLPDAPVVTASCSCNLAEQGERSLAYNEDAFRYFLEIERKRAENANCPLLLLLLDLRAESDRPDSLDAEDASRLFEGLSASLRETDFFGWYREHSTIGAVLTQRGAVAGHEASSDITDRVTSRLRAHLPEPLLSRLQVRVFQLSSRQVGPQAGSV